MAEAPVEFLLENLKQLLLHHGDLIKGVKNELEKLESDIRLFKAFLMDTTKKLRKDEKLQELVRHVLDAVYEAEDAIDSFVTQAAVAKSKNLLLRFQNRAITEQVDSVCGKIREVYGHKRKVDFALINCDNGEPPEINKVPILRLDNVVGFEDEAEKLIGYLSQETEDLDVISIIGMPGLGKTTLAGKIYHDLRIQFQFPVRIWIYVSQEFTNKYIFLSILKEFTRITEDIIHKSDQDLSNLVARYLASGKFLIVLDDVWTTADWDKLLIALPKSNKRSKVLITSQTVKVGLYAKRFTDPHMLRFLTLEESWLLLRLEVFGKPDFPYELETEGRQIAERCGGLPLAIVVIGGILAKRSLDLYEICSVKRVWGKVAESFNTYLKHDDSERRMEKIISLSYKKLPSHLKACFLYVGMFCEDFEIPASKLILMWIAEGFIQRKANVSLEETAESYLDDLINRNLVRVDKLKANGRVKTCRVHNILRDFCISEAGIRRENLFQEIKMSSEGSFDIPVSESHKYRRLSLHSNALKFFIEKPSCPRVRSFVCFSKDETQIQPEYISVIPTGFKLLRVLDAKPIKFTKLPSEFYQLLHLRFVVLTFITTSAVLPASLSKLWNLQTLIVDITSRTLDIRVDILNMIQLRHFKTNASATLSKTMKSSRGGEQIQTLGKISPESCSEEVFSKARSLKKLGVRGKLAWLLRNNEGSFDSLGNLGNLENLKLINDMTLCSETECKLYSLPPAYKFPTQLRSLMLCDTCLDWSHMSVLGSLDKLEVLKLKDRAFWGETWETTAGGFRNLKVLHIGRTNLEYWVASRHHFPKLKRLELRNCENLIEVPIELASIPNLELLDLHQSNNAAASAKRICERKRRLEDQQPENARRFKLSIFPPEE